MLIQNGLLFNRERTVGEIRDDIVYITEPSLAPYYFKFRSDLNGWLAERALDGTRSHSRLIKRIQGLAGKSDAEVALAVHGASVTDGFWVKSFEEPGLTYDQVKFTTDTLFDLSLYGDLNDTEASNPSPQLTLIGSLEKGWMKEDDWWCLYKVENSLQVFNERFLQYVSVCMGIPSTYYTKTESGVRSLNFACDADFEDAFSIVGDKANDYLYCYDRISSVFDDKAAHSYLKLLYFDAVCRNMDRHSHNFGFLRDQKSGEFLGMAPNFDFDQSLFGNNPQIQIKVPSEVKEDLLMKDFLELLKEKQICFEPVVLSREDIEQEVDPDLLSNPFFESAVKLVLSRQKYLLEKIQDICQDISKPEL